MEENTVRQVVATRKNVNMAARAMETTTDPELLDQHVYDYLVAVREHDAATFAAQVEAGVVDVLEGVAGTTMETLPAAYVVDRGEIRVRVYAAADGWRWHAQAMNGELVAESGEAYVNVGDAIEAAERWSPDTDGEIELSDSASTDDEVTPELSSPDEA